MTDIVKQKKSLNPLTVGVTGLLVGAAGATAIALADEPTRKRATKKAKQISADLQKWSSQKLETMKNKKESAQRLINEKTDPIAEEINGSEL